MSTELMETSPRAMSVADVLQTVNKIQELLQVVMKEGKHYGNIPGTDKPTLLLPGAQKIGQLFGVRPDYKVDRTELGDGHFDLQVTCTLYSIAHQTIVGEGLGSCSTMESKYRWRRTKGFEVLDEPIPDDYRQRKADYKAKGYGAKKVGSEWKWVKYSDGAERVENPDIADVYNTVLKMAKKRAYTDAIITTFAASDIFAQDLDDDYLAGHDNGGAASDPPGGNAHGSQIGSDGQGSQNGNGKPAKKKTDPGRQHIIDDIVQVLLDPVFTDEDREQFKHTVRELRSLQELTDHLNETEKERDRRKAAAADAGAEAAFDGKEAYKDKEPAGDLSDQEPPEAAPEQSTTESDSLYDQPPEGQEEIF